MKVRDLKKLRDKARAQPTAKAVWATALDVMMPFLQVREGGREAAALTKTRGVTCADCLFVA